MPRRHRAASIVPTSLLLAALAGLTALAGCRSAATAPSRLADEIAAAPPGSEVRLLVHDDRIVGACVPLPPGELPPDVRTTLLAVAPEGDTTLLAREWGERGTGFRIEKRYASPAHQRSVLIAEHGAVLERAHTVAIGDVPPNVLATALQHGLRVDEVWIVSGPLREEYWTAVVQDRSGTGHVVRVGLQGEALGAQRRLSARIDSTAAR